MMRNIGRETIKAVAKVMVAPVGLALFGAVTFFYLVSQGAFDGAASAAPAQVAGGAVTQGATRERVNVTMAQTANEEWRITYQFNRPMRVLDLGPSLGGYRARSWRIVTPGLVFEQRRGRTLLVNEEGEPPFREVEFIATPSPLNAPRQYEPFIPLGKGGVLLYTGHFHPWVGAGRRFDANFTVSPSRRRFVTAFGETKPSLENWRSPFSHPAFLYVGPRPPVSGPRLKGVVDGSTPRWAAAEAEAFANESLRVLESAFGRPAAAMPNLFLAFDSSGPDGLLSFAGDALPGQFRIVLRGGAWDHPNDQARTLLQLHTAHETAHLWQEGARPKTYMVPNWIHEGGANLIAGEVMRRLGIWSLADVDAAIERAKVNCANALAGRSLTKADRAGIRDAIYECGEVLNWLAARRDQRGPAAFWADFVDRARAEGGYDAALFYAVAKEVGGADLGDAMERFTARNFASREQALAALDRLERF